MCTLSAKTYVQKAKTCPVKSLESRHFCMIHTTSYSQPSAAHVQEPLFIDVSFDIATFAGQAMLQSDRVLQYRGSFLM